MHEHRFTVIGIAPFPTDMLRYDEAFPANTMAANHIAASFDRERVQGKYWTDRMLRVELIHRGEQRWWHPTAARWASFGWSVVIDVEEIPE